MPANRKLLVLAGDGIGPEAMRQVLRVVDWFDKRRAVRFEVTEPFIRAGKMRLIASAYSKRVAAFPDTPTMAEQGFPEIDLSAWLGIVVPADTPKDRIDRLGAAFNQIVRTPEMEGKFANLGATPRSLGPKEFAAYVRSEDARWSAVVKSTGLRIE